MGYILDSIIRKDMIGSKDNDGTINYVSINSSDSTISLDISGVEQGLTVQLDYANGASTNIEFVIELSSDNNTFVPITAESVTVTDSDGVILWDIVTNSNFLKVSWEVTTGSVDIYAQLSGKRRH